MFLVSCARQLQFTFWYIFCALALLPLSVCLPAPSFFVRFPFLFPRFFRSTRPCLWTFPVALYCCLHIFNNFVCCMSACMRCLYSACILVVSFCLSFSLSLSSPPPPSSRLVCSVFFFGAVLPFASAFCSPFAVLLFSLFCFLFSLFAVSR